ADLHEEPQGGGARAPLHRGAAPRRRAPLPVPRRVHSSAAARDRAATRGGRPARRVGHERSRARHRRRAARRGDQRRLPRHGRLSPPAVGTRRAAGERGHPRRRRGGGAGRGGGGAAVRGGSKAGLDQFFMREPDKLLGRRVEAAILDHANPRVLAGHVRAAAYEAPLGGAAPPEYLEAARDDPELKETPAGFVWAGREHPAARIALRATDPDAFTIVDGTTGAVLGLLHLWRANTTVHEGAVYLHRGESYLVRELDLTTLHAVVEPFSGNWYTQAKEETMTSIVEPRRVEWRLGMELAFGEIEVTEQVVAYERRTVSGQERIELVELVLPPTTFATEAIWYLPGAQHLEGLEEMPRLLGTLHAAEHAMISLLPLWAMCDRWDIGGLSTNTRPQTGGPTVFIYDGHAGGVGLTERGFEQFEGWVRDTAELLAGCPCSGARPPCVQSPT